MKNVIELIYDVVVVISMEVIFLIMRKNHSQTEAGWISRRS